MVEGPTSWNGEPGLRLLLDGQGVLKISERYDSNGLLSRNNTSNKMDIDTTSGTWRLGLVSKLAW